MPLRCLKTVLLPIDLPIRCLVVVVIMILSKRFHHHHLRAGAKFRRTK